MCLSRVNSFEELQSLYSNLKGLLDIKKGKYNLAEARDLALATVVNVTKIADEFTENGNDVTSSYIIDVEESNHRLLQRDITVSTKDVTKTYDSQPLSDVNFEYLGSLKEGDRIVAEFLNSIDFSIIL